VTGDGLGSSGEDMEVRRFGVWMYVRSGSTPTLPYIHTFYGFRPPALDMALLAFSACVGAAVVRRFLSDPDVVRMALS
jgi:hypothetical protein